MSRSIALAALALLPLCSCFSNTYEVAETEVLIRYLPEQDELLVLEIEHGIGVSDPTPERTRKAAEALRGIAGGKRIYPASGTWFAVDIDELMQRARADEPTEHEVTEPERAELLEFIQTIHVEDHGMYLDEERGLSLFRLTRLQHIKRVIEITNAYLNRQMRENPDQFLSPEPEFPFFDAASRELFRSAVAKNHAWLSIQERAVVLDMPMTNASAARCLAWIASEFPESKDRPDELMAFQQLSSLEVTGGHVRLQFGGAAKPIVRFTYRSEHNGSSARLFALVMEGGAKLGGGTAPDAALAKVRGVPDQIRSK